MPTKAQLKAINNTDIRLKTADNSIPTNVVASAIDSSLDYTDQEVSAVRALDVTYFNNDSADPYVNTSNAGLQFVRVDTNSFNGNGQIGNPLKKLFYNRTSQIYASASGNPTRSKNFFNGMQLPDGVTETFTRVSSGIYRATYSGADTITDLDLTDGSKLFHFSFSSMPTNTGSDLKIQSIGSTNTGGTRTIFVEFHNLPSGLLTDNFNGYLYYEVKFFQ